jgi:putative ATP-dependent endonuclease of OLD family
MARIRKIEISNFRCIKSLTWLPSPGLNCLIGPGDSGKSTLLDAIDLCLGARRSAQFTDADFFGIDVSKSISVTLTIGELDEGLKNIETYGLYLRGFNSTTGEVEDEPEKNLETVLCLNLSVGADLEPVWALVSDRARAQNANRNLAWGDRVRLAPTRIGAMAEFNLSWRRGSVLNQLTNERADASEALARAAREARTSFGSEAEAQLGETLAIVQKTASNLGIEVGAKVRALLDAHSVAFSGGTISLHYDVGVPLHRRGMGSTRLLAAGLQRAAAENSQILLIDELEYGLEPHRIIRFLGSVGAKEKTAPLQVFVTTHSPIALRELSGVQLHVFRREGENHVALNVGDENDIQSTLRLYPEAFLASSVLVCEGASEVGFVRGFDQHQAAKGSEVSFTACGAALVDCGGGEADKPFKRGLVFLKLGYRVAVLRDSDLTPTAAVEEEFRNAGGHVISWREGRTLEEELFASLPAASVGALLGLAVDIHGEAYVDSNIRSASDGGLTLTDAKAAVTDGIMPPKTRQTIGKASRSKRAGWFKSVSWMEEAAQRVIAPVSDAADPGFKVIVDDLFGWLRRA